jgi:hypothetical protein
MNVAHLFVLVLTLAVTAPLRAQECAGGPDGGADATGHQCNNPPIARIDDAPASTATNDDDPVAIRTRALEQYERGHYNAAVDLFRRAGERGDIRSAEMIVLMHRHKARLYGGRVAISDAEAKRWAAIVARKESANVASRAREQR